MKVGININNILCSIIILCYYILLFLESPVTKAKDEGMHIQTKLKLSHKRRAL